MIKKFYCIALTSVFISASDTSFTPIALDPISREWEFTAQTLTQMVKKYEKNTEYMRYCPCINLKTRISFAREIIRELMIRHPRTQELEYVSFASGALLQDYIVILGLVLMGYQKLNISFIDLMYEKGVTIKIIEEFSNQLNKEIQKSSAPIPPIIYIQNFASSQSYLMQNKPKPDIILFADPDMSAFTSYDPKITLSGIIDFPSLKSKVIMRNNEKPAWFISEKADHNSQMIAQDLCKISKSNNSMQSMIEFAAKNQLYHLATNHQFLSFDEFIRNAYFEGSNPLIALLHNDFATALTSSKASAYLMTRQDYLQHDYTLQALSFSGFKHLPCETD